MKHTNTGYLAAIDGLSKFGPILCSLVKELMNEEGIQIQSVDFRVKQKTSAIRKINLSPDKYLGIEDLTDLLGIRVITYFSDDVDRAAKVLSGQFKIDLKNSVDKRKLLDPDRFGYLSLHYIASLKGSRLSLPEYRRFANKKFEVQIRTVLQHAWAEIEHDLGYKAEQSIPRDVRRSFSRIAGILELADDEFGRLRKNLSEYEKHVIETIGNAPETLQIDQSTISAALESEKSLIGLDEIIAEVDGCKLEEIVDSGYAANRANDMIALGVNDLNELLRLSDENKENVKKFATIWLERDGRVKNIRHSFQKGIGMFYLAYVLVAQKDDKDLNNWGKQLRKNNPGLLDEVRQTWKKTQEEPANK